MAIIIVKNADSTSHTWVNQSLAAGGTYTIPNQDLVLWQNDSTFLSAIGNGTAVINDGTADLVGVNEGINWLKQFKKLNQSGAQVVDTTLSCGVLGAQTLTLNSHDFSDRTTWYQNSVQVLNETLTTSDGLTYSSQNANWVNMDSARLTYDYNSVPERDGSFSDRSTRRPIVSVNGVQINDTTVPTTPGYAVDYVTGKITFTGSQAGKTVTVTYWHNNVSNASEWILNPPQTYAYLLQYIEVQFSRSIVFTTPIHVEIWAGGAVTDYGDFNIDLYNAGYGQNKSIYRGARDFTNICTNRASQVIPAFGELTQDVLIYPFDYLIQTQIRSSQGTVVMLALENDIPYGSCELSTITFYMQIVPETSL